MINLRGELGGPYSEGRAAVLRDSYVAYFDELGTKARLHRYVQADLDDDVNKYDDLLHFLDGEPPKEHYSGPRTYVVNTFTDNVSVCKVIEPELAAGVDGYWAAFGFLQGIALYQGNMILRKTLLRGGITSGEVYARPGYVTGRAHVDAVHIEEEVAKYPRIVLAPAFVDRVRPAPGSDAEELFESLIAVDAADQAMYLDYLRFTIVESGDESANAPILLRAHQQLITEGTESLERECERGAVTHVDVSSNRPLDGHIPAASVIGLECDSIMAKYKWLAQYHNEVCKTFRLDSLRIDVPGS